MAYEHLGRLEDGLRVLRDAPEGRRRFLDGGIVGLRPAFLRDLAEYRRVLAERNALLRQIRGAADGRGRELDVWEERLAAVGARVHRERREYAMELGTRLGSTSGVPLLYMAKAPTSMDLHGHMGRVSA